MQEMVKQFLNLAGAGIGVGSLIGFIVIIFDYTFTSVLSMMKGR